MLIDYLIDHLPHLMLLALVLLLFTGFPVGGILAGIGVGFALLGVVLDVFPVPALFLIPYRLYGAIGENLIYPAVPMLLFMGVALSISGATRELLLCLQRLFHKIPGSMCIAVLAIGLLLAPTAGIIGASVATIAVAALPTMLEQKYSPEVSCGSIAAAGTLGVIAPPSIMLFFLADALEIKIADIFLAPLVPIAALAAIYAIFFAGLDFMHGNLRRSSAPADNGSLSFVYFLRSFVLPVGLIVFVLGSIIAGWVAPTESAAIGAGGAAVILFFYRGIKLSVLREALMQTMLITAMVFFVVMGAGIFSLVFRYYDGGDIAIRIFDHLELGDFGILMSILAVLFVLGFFIDWIEIVLVSLPIFHPIIQSLDFTALLGSQQYVHLWIGTLIALVLQTSFLTPPFGFALFFLKGAAPPGVGMASIYRGVAPLVVIQVAMIGAILIFPAIAIWLPSTLLAE